MCGSRLMQNTSTLVLVAILTVGVARAAAQRAELGLTAGRITDEQGIQHTGFTLSPALTWADHGSAVRVSGHGSVFEGGLFGSAAMGIGTRAASLGPLHLILGGEGAIAGSEAGYRAVRGAVNPRLRIADGDWGIEAGPRWAGGGERRLTGSPLGATPGGLDWLGGDASGSTTRWQSEAGIGAGAWYAPGPLTLQAGWRSTEGGGVAWHEWTGAVAVESGGASVGVAAGERTGGLRERWIAGTAGLELGQGASLVAEAGAFPSDPLMGRAGGRFATAGIRLRVGRVGGMSRGALPGPAPFSDGRVSLTLRADPGARVELLADWTEWEPQTVAEVRPGRYEVQVRLPSGTHRFVFRVNGEWRVPDGVETEPDDFGGQQGVIRVRTA